MQDYKGYSPYHGVWVVALLLCAVPAVFALVIWLALSTYQPQYETMNGPTALCIGFGLGSVFHLSCIVVGMLRKPFRAVAFRVSEFFQNLACSPGFAFREYWEDVKQDGVAFDIYLLIILGTFGCAVANLMVALERLKLLNLF